MVGTELQAGGVGWAPLLRAIENGQGNVAKTHSQASRQKMRARGPDGSCPSCPTKHPSGDDTLRAPICWAVRGSISFRRSTRFFPAATTKGPRLYCPTHRTPQRCCPDEVRASRSHSRGPSPRVRRPPGGGWMHGRTLLARTMNRRAGLGGHSR